MARPRKDINYTQAQKLAEIQCTINECAIVLGVSDTKLKRDAEFRAIYDVAREKGKASLRRLQWAAARRGSTAMLIWLGKQYLGQTDRVETDVTTKGERINQQTIRLTPEILVQSIAVLRDAGAIRSVPQPVVSDN